MHEHSLINNLMNKVETIAREQNARKIVGIKIRLGALSHISAEHFREHFEEGSKGTLAEGAQMTIDTSDDIYDPHAQDILLESVEIVETHG